MAFPDRIERTVESPGPRPRRGRADHGGRARHLVRHRRRSTCGRGERADGLEQRRQGRLRIERVEEPTVFGFTWHIYGLPDEDPRRTYVEFTLEPLGAGTRLTVVESGFTQLPDEAYRKAYSGNTKGWAPELGDLVDYLNAA